MSKQIADCDVFELRGNSWQLLSEQGIVFEKDAVIIQGTKTRVSLSELSNLSRFQDPDDSRPCFQFLTSSSEFGLKFADDAGAEFFFLEVSRQAAAQTVSKIVCSRDIRLSELRGGSGWCEVVSSGSDLTVTVAERPKDFECFLFIKKKSEIVFSSSLTSALCLRFFPAKLEVTFVGQDGRTGEGHYFALNFSDKEEFSNFQKICDSAIASKAKQTPVVVETEEFSDQEEAFTPRSGPSSDEDGMEIDRLGLAKDKRRVMAVGGRKNRVYVASGTGRGMCGGSRKLSGISAFRVGEGKIRHLGVVGEAVAPEIFGSFHLFEGESSLLYSSAARGVEKLDLEKESVVKIVEPETAAIEELVEPGEGKVFFGLNANTLFCLDSRLQNSVVGKHSYSSKVRMSCGAQTGQQNQAAVAVGSRTGQVRLYDGKLNQDGELKRAKSLFPGLGDAVTGLEVSSCGNWLLVTSDQYVQLVKVTDGFSRSITGEKQPRVFSAKLTIPGPLLVQHGISRVCLSKAHFNELGDSVISSTGSFRVSWDLAAAKKGQESVRVWKVAGEVVDLHRIGGGEVVALYDDGIGVAKR